MCNCFVEIGKMSFKFSIDIIGLGRFNLGI